MEGFKFNNEEETKNTADLIPDGIFDAELSSSQIAGIRHALICGRDLQIKIPEIADDFRAGLTLDKIVEKHNLQNKLGGSFSTVRNAVWFALRGYNEELRYENISAFPGLIKKDEYEVLARKHVDDHIAEVGRGNREVGLRQYAEKKGIHAQTPEERKVVVRMAHEAMGRRVYEKEEIDLIEELIRLPEFQHGSRIKAGKIAEEVNKRLHNRVNVRSAKDVTRRHRRTVYGYDS